MPNFVDCWNSLKSKGYKHADGSEVLNNEDRASIEARIQEHLKTGLDPIEAAKASVKSHLDEAHAQLQSVYDQVRSVAKPPETSLTGEPLVPAMMQATRESLKNLRDQVSNVRYGKPGEILFEFKGQTHSAPEPTDVMPAEDATGTNKEASRSWALKQVLDKKAQPVSEAGQAPAVSGQPKIEGGTGEEVQKGQEGREAVLATERVQPPAVPPVTTAHPAVTDFQETSSPQSLGIVPRPSEFVRQDVSRVVTGISKGIRQIKAALTPANVSPIAGQTARIVREHAGQLARDREIATTALQDAAQIMRRNSKVENLAIIDRLEKGEPIGNKGLEDYKNVRQTAYDQRIKQVQEVNPKAMQDLIENYFPHLWTRESIERLSGNIEGH